MLVADTSGESVANKRRLDLIRQQEQLIQKEAEEKEVEVSTDAKDNVASVVNHWVRYIDSAQRL